MWWFKKRSAFIKEALTLIIQQLSIIIKQNEKIMATIAEKLAEVKQSLVDLQTSVNTTQSSVLAAIDDLKEQVANGGAVTIADLDDLIVTVKSIQTDVDTTDLDGTDTP